MRIRGPLAAGLILVCPLHPLKAQDAGLQQANRQAQQVVDRAVEAYGGREKLRAMSRQFTWVLEGELVITRGGEQVRGKTGDVIYIPKGSSITFGTPSWTRFVYVVYPVNWNEK